MKYKIVCKKNDDVEFEKIFDSEQEADYYAGLADKYEYDEHLMHEEHQREVIAEVKEAKFDAWLELNISSLETDFIKDHKDDFEEYCRIVYEEFKED